MNIFGIGALELAVILLVAFIALGPGKTMEVARTIGRMVREARRALTDIMDAASVDDTDTDGGKGGPGGPSGGGANYAAGGTAATAAAPEGTAETGGRGPAAGEPMTGGGR